MTETLAEPLAEARFTVEIIEDPGAFLDAAGDHLALDPVLTTVVSTVTHRALAAVEAGAAPPSHPRWWALVRDEVGAVVGVAMRTAPFPPHPLFVLPMPEAAVRALARLLHDRGEEVAGCNGALPAARQLADASAEQQGRVAVVHERTRLFELGDLVEPAHVPGRLRRAELADADLVLAWFRAFEADAAEQAGRREDGPDPVYLTPDDMVQRIVDRRIWLWETEDGERVHLTGRTSPSFGVVRVGPVYTPREHRGNGYASAAVAGVSRRLVAEGVRVCLFTDQANPTSNRIYQRLGFRPVVDMANLVVR